MLDQIGTVLAVIGGVMLVGGALIGLVAFAFIRKFDEQRDRKQGELMTLQQEELKIYRLRADRVPELEKQVEVLREEVGAAKAIAEHDGKTQQELGRIQERIAKHDERAARADAWQASKNDALIDGLNRLLAHYHEKPVVVASPPEPRHG